MDNRRPATTGTRIRRRTIVGGIAVAALAVLAAQVLLRGLFFDLTIIDGRIVSIVFHTIVVAVPVVFFLAWRSTVEKEARVEEMLRDSEALREDMTSMLVHDLKNPVISAGLALRSLSSSPEFQSCIPGDEREMLDIASESLSGLENMIDNMLDIARAEAGAMPIVRGDVDLADIVRRVARRSLPQLTDARVELRLMLGDGPVCARADAGKIARVMDNLLANAIRFTPPGSAIEIHAATKGDRAVVTVRDSGPGIPDSLQARIFEKFGQVEAHRQKARLSVGLGLYFCKLVVDAHGGRIWVESAEGGGSIFGISLPVHGASGRSKGFGDPDTEARQ